MNRKEWLETFLRLADSGAPTIQYRKALRIINVNVLKGHVARIPEYREELEALCGKKAQEPKIEEKKVEEPVEKPAAEEGDAKEPEVPVDRDAFGPDVLSATEKYKKFVEDKRDGE